MRISYFLGWRDSPATANLMTSGASLSFKSSKCNGWYVSMTLQNAPKTTATTVKAAISKPYFRMADNGMAIMPILVCHHHSGGLNGIFLANTNMIAAMIHVIMHSITGTVMSPWIPHKANTTTNQNQPIAPQANWRPTSARPDDVSRVAIMMAVFSNVMIDTGNKSAMIRMAKYDQYVTKRSPSICKLNAKTIRKSFEDNHKDVECNIPWSIDFRPTRSDYCMVSVLRIRSLVCILCCSWIFSCSYPAEWGYYNWIHLKNSNQNKFHPSQNGVFGENSPSG